MREKDRATAATVYPPAHSTQEIDTMRGSLNPARFISGTLNTIRKLQIEETVGEMGERL